MFQEIVLRAEHLQQVISQTLGYNLLVEDDYDILLHSEESYNRLLSD